MTFVAERGRGAPTTNYRTRSSRASGTSQSVTGHAEGDGGSSGIVLPLTETVGSSGVGYGTSYSLPIWVGGGNNQEGTKVWVQIDTGSSDLWLASSQCTSDPCKGVSSSNKYDPTTSSSAQPAGIDFQINYLRGKVSGPIYWDTISIHPEDDNNKSYVVQNQAFAAAQTVEDEPLNEVFNGLLGLALPLNSVINSNIPSGFSDAPDGATFSSNLFGLTGGSGPPSQRFFGLCFSRPGSTKWPALLGIGRHPEQVPGWENKSGDLKKSVKYSTLLSQSTGPKFWRSSVRSLSVYVDGTAKEVALSASQLPHFSSPYPVAVYDTGIPVIFASKTITDAVYGAINVSPSSDGYYYLPCSTPLNISVTLDSRESPIWIHPLDLSSQNGNDPSSCIGLLQSFPVQQDGSASASAIADIILGTPFLRNVYMVLGLDEVDENGDFKKSSMTDDVEPRLGLLGVTKPSDAYDDWQMVRVKHGSLNNPGSSNGSGATSDQKGLSVGIKVLIGLVSFFAACALLFALRWLIMSRRQRANTARELGHEEGGETGGKGEFFKMKNFGVGGYLLAKRRSSEDLAPKDRVMSEDELRKIRFEAHLAKRRQEEGAGVALLNPRDRGLGTYGGEKDFGWEDRSDSSQEMPLTKPRLSIITEKDEEAVEVKSMMTSAKGSAGHSPTSPIARNMPPVPSLSSAILAGKLASVAPSQDTLSTPIPPSQGLPTASDPEPSSPEFIPPGAAKPHTFFPNSTPSRPISFGPIMDPATFLQPDSPPMKFLPSLHLHSPLMTSSDFLPQPSASNSTRPASIASSTPSRHSTPPVLQSLPPPVNSSLISPPSIPSANDPSVQPPKEILGEFGVLSRNSSASTNKSGGMAGVGAHKKAASLGFVFNPESTFINPTLTIPSLLSPQSDPETTSTTSARSGYGTSMYATDIQSPLSRTESIAMKSPLSRGDSVSAEMKSILSRNDSAEAKPPSLNTLGGIAEESNEQSDSKSRPSAVPTPLNLPSTTTSADEHAPPSLISPPAATPRIRIQRPTGPRQNSMNTMSWHSHGSDGSLT